MRRSPSLRTACVATSSLLIAGFAIFSMGGFGGGSTAAATGLTNTQLNRQIPSARTSTGPASSSSGPSSSVGAAATRKTPSTRSTTSNSGAASTMPGMSMPTPPITEPLLAPVSLAGTKPSTVTPPRAQFHEFQADCTITDHRSDDPIVFPGMAGVSHNHTFFGNTTTTANSTLASLQKGKSSCKVPADLTAYWMPTLYNGTKVIDPTGTIVYYKSDVIDYTSVRAFPKGLRFVAGSPTSTQAQFTHGFWSCGSHRRVSTIPAVCEPGSRLFARYQSPSCWDGVHLDVSGHKAHMAYPVKGRCPADHPVALPMLEFKIPYPVNGDMSRVHLSSGAGFTFHYDFINDWEDATLSALVKTCINGGLQCDARGYDQHHPNVPAALSPDYTLKP